MPCVRLFAQEPCWSRHAPTPEELFFHVLSPLLLQNQAQSCSSASDMLSALCAPSFAPHGTPVQLAGVGDGAACNFLFLRLFGPKPAASGFNEQTNPGL